MIARPVVEDASTITRHQTFGRADDRRHRRFEHSKPAVAEPEGHYHVILVVVFRPGEVGSHGSDLGHFAEDRPHEVELVHVDLV